MVLLNYLALGMGDPQIVKVYVKAVVALVRDIHVNIAVFLNCFTKIQLMICIGCAAHKNGSGIGVYCWGNSVSKPGGTAPSILLASVARRAVLLMAPLSL